MAASRSAAARARGAGGGGGGAAALRRLKLAVEGFVRARGLGAGAPGGGGGPRAGGAARPSGRERRRERRRRRRARRGRRGAGGAAGEAEPAEPADPADPADPARSPSGAARSGETVRSRSGAPGSAAAAAARRRALLAANAEEDREIRRLRRRLGLGRRRGKARAGAAEALPPGFARDGLDYVLGALGGGGAARPPGRDLLGSGSDDDEDGDGSETEEAGDGSEMEEDGDGSETEEDGDGSETEEAGDGSEMEEEEEAEPPQPARKAGESCREKNGKKRVRFAEEEAKSGRPPLEADPLPQQSVCTNGGKYIPPQARQAEAPVDSQKAAVLARLRKQVQGLVNRLSEPNLASISGQLEDLFMAHSHKDMKDTLTSVLLAACAPPDPMPGQLVREHVLLLAVLHCTVGPEVGAHFLEAVVRRFHAVYEAGGGPGKECENLFSVLAQLYNFDVVPSGLVLDALRRLLDAFCPRSLELVLQMLRDVGFSLRRDDAAGLRELITQAQALAGRAGPELREQTRVRFLLDAMLALKNNDVRKIPGYDPEPVERLRRLRRTLVRGTGSEALDVSWDAVLHAEQRGRWWVVGSAWSGAPMIEDEPRGGPQEAPVGTVSAKILELARRQRMNTDVRRTIFCAIVTSEDYLDAFEKLLRLGLTERQEREVVHVLLDCCLQERAYNPFYAFLASRLCAHHRRFQMTFQFSIWDKFREVQSLPAAARVNLEHLVAHLLKTRALPLSLLKVVEFSELDKPRIHFLRKVLHELLTDTEAEDLSSIFARVADNPKLTVLREGLKLFISHFLTRSRADGSSEEAGRLREHVDLVARALQGRAALRL